MDYLMNAAIGLGLALVGASLVLGHKQFVRQVEDFHARWFRLRYGRGELRLYEYGGVVAGIVFIVVGVLTVAGRIAFVR